MTHINARCCSRSARFQNGTLGHSVGPFSCAPLARSQRDPRVSVSQLYDTYGEEMLQIMEGNGGPDVAAKVFARISMAQRAQLVLFFFAATSLLMLTPIFIVLR